MSDGNIYPLERRCSCGAGDLIWEHREDSAGVRSMAVCTNPHCGIITTPNAVHAEPTDLRTFLVGRTSVPRYLRPWTRLFLQSIEWGFRWRPHQASCTACNHELTIELRLPPKSHRCADPHHIILCVECGTTTTTFCVGGKAKVYSIEGRAWEEPPAPLRALKRALEERAYEPRIEGPFG